MIGMMRTIGMIWVDANDLEISTAIEAGVDR